MLTVYVEAHAVQTVHELHAVQFNKVAVQGEQIDVVLAQKPTLQVVQVVTVLLTQVLQLETTQAVKVSTDK